MKQNICQNCAYFYQHYGINEKKIYRLNCGHCVRGRMRRALPLRKACESFSPAKVDPDRFVSREYLSRSLLDYMMKLDLLPQIFDLLDDIR